MGHFLGDKDNLLLYNSKNNNLIKLEKNIYFDYLIKINNNDIIDLDLKLNKDFKKLCDLGFFVDYTRDEKNEVVINFEKINIILRVCI
ncbi:MAG: hypothetical protein LBG23_03085 [Endomicrobium sp.]|jgi:hypothetical protein|nr:hypothetical protein [Endomicrobium sp.]